LGQGPAGERIAWQGGVLANLEEEKVALADGTAETHLFIKDATFKKQVAFTRPRSEDSLRCDDTLQVWMARGTRRAGRRSRRYLRQAEASGNVTARQAGSDICADQMTVTFAEVLRKEPTTAPVETGKQHGDGGDRWGVRPVRLFAKGNVRAGDQQDDELVRAFADTLELETDGPWQTGVLRGKPARPDDLARIVQGDSALHGREIRLDQARESVIVEGPGKTQFRTDRGLDGRPLSEPRPVEVTWAKGMEFDGPTNKATFEGDVLLNSGDSTMSCGKMVLILEKPTATNRPAKLVESEPPRKPGQKKPRRLRLEMASNFRNHRLAQIDLQDQVVMTRVVPRQGGGLLKRTRMDCRNLTWDARTGETIILGAGTMSAEDYALGSSKDPKADRSGAARRPAWLDRPSQTLFWWKEKMRVSGKRPEGREVFLKGDVVMKHRSGDQIVWKQALKLSVLGKLPAGRRTDLSCDQLTAMFSEPQRRATSQPTSAPAQRLAAEVFLGRLRSFHAEGRVDLTDGRRTIAGHRLNYDRKRELVLVEGKDNRAASLIYQDATGAASKRVESPRIEIYLQDGEIIHVKTGEITVGG